MSDEIYLRTAATLEVRHPERVVDLLAAPYDQDANVMHRGRWIVETIAPGAFNGVAGDVFVNRAHDRERPLGRVVRFHPNDRRGLRAELRISKTREGDEVLELADDGLLSASVGMQPILEEYSADGARRRITRARLDHVALTGNPAYVGARVLAVRNVDTEPVARIPTPNLDRVRLEARLEAAGMLRSVSQ